MKHRFAQHDNWATPTWLLDNIRHEFGILYDPCPLYAEYDGLNIEWPTDKTVYINPPYSRKLKELFIAKAYEHWRNGGQVVMLLPVSTSTKIFHDLIYPYAEIRFLRGRIKFAGYNTNGEYVTNKTDQHDSMLVIYRHCHEKTLNNNKSNKQKQMPEIGENEVE